MKANFEEEIRMLRTSVQMLRRNLEDLDSRIEALERSVTSEGADTQRAQESQIPPPLPENIPDAIPVLSDAAVEDRAHRVNSSRRGAREPATRDGYQAHEVPPARMHGEPPPLPPEVPESFELKLGRYWLVRAGILVLLTALVLLGNYAYRALMADLGAVGKLGLLCAIGGALTLAGACLERRMASVRNYARVLMAGGAATIYYAAYAAHFVDSLRVIRSPLLGGAILLALAGLAIWVAERQKSEGVALTAVLLSYYTSAINPAAGFTMWSNLLLAGVAVVLLMRQRWIRLTWLALIGTYATFVYWRAVASSSLGEFGGTPFWQSHGVLCLQWSLFTFAVFVNRGTAFDAIQRGVFLTVNNAAFFGLFGAGLARAFPSQFWLFAILFGTALAGLAGAARLVRSEALSFDGAYVAQSLSAITIGLAAKFGGYQLALILGIESVMLQAAARHRHRIIFQAGAALAAVMAAGSAVSTRLQGNTWLPGVVAGLLILDAWLCRLQQGGNRLNGSALAFSIAAVLVSIAAIPEATTVEACCRILAAAAISITLAASGLRLPELGIASQLYLVATWIGIILLAVEQRFTWANTIPGLAATAGLMHWWQWREPVAGRPAAVFQPLYALAVAAILYTKILAEFHGPDRMVASAACGLCVLAYAIATRALPLAITSQFFSLTAAVLYVEATIWGAPPWREATWALMLLAAQPGLARLLYGVLPERACLPVRRALVGYRGATIVLGILWILEYVPLGARSFALLLVAMVLFVSTMPRRSDECLTYSGLLAVAGVIAFVNETLVTPRASAYAVGAMLLLSALAVLEHRYVRSLLPAVRATVLVISTAGIWAQASKWAWFDQRAIAATFVWAVVAFASLAAGFGLRERALRLSGLVILAVAVGQVFLIDVWKLGALAGILGMLVLALVLLALGFVYNRFASEIRKWL